MFKPTTLAMILAGGRVDELGVLTCYRPKAAVPFGGFARVIDFPLSNLMKSGIELIAILSQYRSYSLINHIGTGAAWDMIGRYRGISILPPFKDYESPHWYRGSADAVYQNFDFIKYHDPKEILILSGDHIYQMDYRELIRYHNEKNADLTAAFIQVPQDETHRFGIADISDQDQEGGRVLSYSEKPAESNSKWASLTVYCFKPEVLYEVLEKNQHDESYEFGRDIIPLLMKQNYRVYGYKFAGYWGYTGTVEEYWQTNMDLLGANPKINMEEWGLRTNLEHRGIRDSQPLKVGDFATIDNSLIYNGCMIDGTVKNSILFPGVHVEKGAEIRDSVLFFNTVVRKGSRLNKVISDVNTTFGQNVQIGDIESENNRNAISVVGWNNRVPDNISINQGCTVYPGITPEKWPDRELTAGEVLR